MRKSIAVVFAVFTLFLCVQHPINVADADENRYSKAECVMEMQSRRILYEESGDLRLPMASTTKIVTLLTVLNECETLEEVIEIPKVEEGVEGSSVYLKAGEKYTIKELLYGLMLRSGNDCATALALSPCEYLTSGSLVKRPIKITLFIRFLFSLMLPV